MPTTEHPALSETGDGRKKLVEISGNTLAIVQELYGVAKADSSQERKRNIGDFTHHDTIFNTVSGINHNFTDTLARILEAKFDDTVVITIAGIGAYAVFAAYQMQMDKDDFTKLVNGMHVESIRSFRDTLNTIKDATNPEAVRDSLKNAASDFTESSNLKTDFVEPKLRYDGLRLTTPDKRLNNFINELSSGLERPSALVAGAAAAYSALQEAISNPNQTSLSPNTEQK